MEYESGKSELFLNNSLTRKKEPFLPREPGKVKMFTCGPSIYRRPHLGNYRAFLFEDILLRYLEYLGYQLERVINFTDVEDKALAEAKGKGLTLKELTDPVARQFREEARILKIKLPDCIPRSSTTVDQAVHLIKVLLEKGYAYWYGPDVFYDPLKFADFGKLFGLDMSRWPQKKRRFSKDTYPGQRWNLGDFILWHGYSGKKPDESYWKTEIGQGRPAWNVQDPAVISKHLGYQIDISVGGVDNLFRHHDYTIAVMEAVSGKNFARYWLHCEHMFVNGAKMSKSKGNVTYPEDLLNKDYTPEHIRFFLTCNHYREKLNLNPRALQESRIRLDSFRDKIKKITETKDAGIESQGGSAEALINRLNPSFSRQMNDDLNVKTAFDAIYEIFSGLLALKLDGKMTRQDSERAGKEFAGINSVLQIM